MRLLGLTLFVTLFATLTVASTTSTPTSTAKPGQYVLHKPDNSFPTGLDAKSARFDTLEACQKAAESAGAGLFKCDQSVAVTVTVVVTSTCTDEPAPTLPMVQKEIDGQKYWSTPEDGLLLPPPPTPENGWATMIYVYVKNPQANAYPNCWIRGWAPESDWEPNPNYPNTPYMQIKGQHPIAESPNDESYTCWPGDTECVPPAAPPA